MDRRQRSLSPRDRHLSSQRFRHIDLENKQIIFDDSSKLQFSFDDFNDELLIADKRYKKMKPTFNN